MVRNPKKAFDFLGNPQIIQYELSNITGNTTPIYSNKPTISLVPLQLEQPPAKLSAWRPVEWVHRAGPGYGLRGALKTVTGEGEPPSLSIELSFEVEPVVDLHDIKQNELSLRAGSEMMNPVPLDEAFPRSAAWPTCPIQTVVGQADPPETYGKVWY